MSVEVQAPILKYHDSMNSHGDSKKYTCIALTITR